LQCLAHLHIEHLSVAPAALKPLTLLTQLTHISWRLGTPLLEAPSSIQSAHRLIAYLELWSTWDLPLTELEIMWGVLTPRALQLIGQLRRLAVLELTSCKAQVDGVSYERHKVSRMLRWA
jgi:hypothetical protein